MYSVVNQLLRRPGALARALLQGIQYKEPHMSQVDLLRRRRFAAIFWTQFLGAFNDNLFKNALVILITYKSIERAGARRRAIWWR